MHTILPLWTALQNLDIGMHIAAQFWTLDQFANHLTRLETGRPGWGYANSESGSKSQHVRTEIRAHLCAGHFHQLFQHVVQQWSGGFNCRQQLSVVSRTTASGSSPGHKWYSSHAIHRCPQLRYAVVTAFFLASYKAGFHLSYNPFWPLYILGPLVQSLVQLACTLLSLLVNPLLTIWTLCKPFGLLVNLSSSKPLDQLTNRPA